MTRTDNKITLVNIKFNLNTCKNLTKKELDTFSDTTTNFFHFVQAFGSKLKLRYFVNIWMVEDRVQDLNSVTCSIFQNANKKRLNKQTIETLLHELFVLDDPDTNEATIQQYANKNNILLQWLTDLSLQLLYEDKTYNFRLQKWVTG